MFNPIVSRIDHFNEVYNCLPSIASIAGNFSWLNGYGKVEPAKVDPKVKTKTVEAKSFQ